MTACDADQQHPMCSCMYDRLGATVKMITVWQLLPAYALLLQVLLRLHLNFLLSIKSTVVSYGK